jgi:hypothetical protein
MRIHYFIPAVAVLLTSASTALATTSTCTTTVACIVGQNSSTGASSDIGVEGLSSHGFGLVGVTSAAPTASSGRVAGLYGKDQGSTTFNSGVSAFSQNGTGLISFGVNGNGVTGLTTASPSDTAAAAVLGQDQGTNPSNEGVLGLSQNGTGIFGVSLNSDGVDAEAESTGVGVNALGGAQGTQVVQIETVGNGDLIDGFNGAGSTPAIEFYIDNSGNETLTGTLTDAGGTVASTQSRTGTNVASYGARSASPTLEDFGQGSLRQGYGHVALDPTFASTIDTRNYLVFVTPHGDSHGLYTTIVSDGFDVHENEQGRSSMTFDYRVVGKPIDMASAGHLPTMASINRPGVNARARFSALRAKPNFRAVVVPRTF